MLQRVFHKRGKGCGEPSEGRCAVSKGEGTRQKRGKLRKVLGFLAEEQKNALIP